MSDETITVTLTFSYEKGEPGFFTENPINNVEDAIKEARAELEHGNTPELIFDQE
jgi:hypothetical protein